MDAKQREAHGALVARLRKEGLLDGEFCTDEEVTRFLKARNFDPAKSYKMIREAILWRREARPQALTPKSVEEQAVTGKTYVAGRDAYGRPVIVMDSSCENSKDHAAKINFLLFNLEYAKMLMRGSVDKWVLFIYLDKFSFWSMPPMKTSKETNNCLMQRYPERLGHCILYNAPTLFNVLWKVVSPFIDPRTKKKILFMSGSFAEGSKNDSNLQGIIGPKWRQLVGVESKHSPQSARGYDHEKYWPAVTEAFAERASVAEKKT